MENNFSLKHKSIESSNTKVSMQLSIIESEILSLIDNKEYLVLAYLDNEVLIGKIVNGKYEFENGNQLDFNYLQKIRIFNSESELYIWKTNAEFKGRLRKDKDGSGDDVVDSVQALWGTDVIQKGNYSKLIEDRGTELNLPFNNISIDDKKKRAFIKTRSYITYNEIGQAGYTDTRLIGFYNQNLERLQ